MYPSLPGRNDPPRGTYGSYGLNSNILSTPSHGSAAASHAQQQHAGAASGLASASSLDCSPWGTETSSTLRVKLAENFKLAPAVQVPPALAASSRSLQEVDYDFERQVLSNDASTSFDGFLSKPETAFYDNTKANKFVRAGFSPAVVNLALAYHSTTRGDETQIMLFCENLKTLTQDMSFGMSLAAGALISAKNDLSTAANQCTELS